MILAPNGQPASSAPPVAPPTLADLSDLLERMRGAEERMGVANPHRELLGEAAWWLVKLGERVIELQKTVAPRDHGEA